jgi:hypothetical protein
VGIKVHDSPGPDRVQTYVVPTVGRVEGYIRTVARSGCARSRGATQLPTRGPSRTGDRYGQDPGAAE